MIIAIVICRQSQVVIAMRNACWNLGGFTGDRRIYHGTFPVETSTCCVWELSSGQGEGSDYEYMETKHLLYQRYNLTT